MDSIFFHSLFAWFCINIWVLWNWISFSCPLFAKCLGNHRFISIFFINKQTNIVSKRITFVCITLTSPETIQLSMVYFRSFILCFQETEKNGLFNYETIEQNHSLCIVHGCAFNGICQYLELNCIIFDKYYLLIEVIFYCWYRFRWK